MWSWPTFIGQYVLDLHVMTRCGRAAPCTAVRHDAAPQWFPSHTCTLQA